MLSGIENGVEAKGCGVSHGWQTLYNGPQDTELAMVLLADIDQKMPGMRP